MDSGSWTLKEHWTELQTLNWLNSSGNTVAGMVGRLSSDYWTFQSSQFQSQGLGIGETGEIQGYTGRHRDKGSASSK